MYGIPQFKEKQPGLTEIHTHSQQWNLVMDVQKAQPYLLAMQTVGLKYHNNFFPV